MEVPVAAAGVLWGLEVEKVQKGRGRPPPNRGPRERSQVLSIRQLSCEASSLTLSIIPNSTHSSSETILYFNFSFQTTCFCLQEPKFCSVLAVSRLCCAILCATAILRYHASSTGHGPPITLYNPSLGPTFRRLRALSGASRTIT